MAIVCNASTWVPYFSQFASTCLQLRQLYVSHGLDGARGQGLGGRNCAAIFYRRSPAGRLCHVTNSSESGVGASRHSEQVCYDELLAREGGHLPPVIEFLYTERYPCGPDNMNCLGLLNRMLPDGTPVFWSFDYPDSSDLDQTGHLAGGKRKREEDRDEAKKRRKSGTTDLKNYQRDIDYKGSTTVSGALNDADGGQVSGLFDNWRQTGKLPNPVPSSFA